MSETQQPRDGDRARSVDRRFVHGLNRSVAGNAQAFGFSVTVTVTFGVISTAQSHPSLPDLFCFAMSAVAAFSLLNLVVAHLIKGQPEPPEPTRVLLVATATDLLAVAGAVAAAVAIRHLASGITAWILAPFCAGLIYVLVQAIELAVSFAEAHEEAGTALSPPPTSES